jgi:hypothetical protein
MRQAQDKSLSLPACAPLYPALKRKLQNSIVALLVSQAAFIIRCPPGAINPAMNIAGLIVNAGCISCGFSRENQMHRTMYLIARLIV